MAKDSAAGIELGRSFHQERKFNVKVSESDFMPLWDGNIAAIQESIAIVQSGQNKSCEQEEL